MLIASVAVAGNSTLVLFSAAVLFRAIKALEASTTRMASVSSASKIFPRHRVIGGQFGGIFP